MKFAFNPAAMIKVTSALNVMGEEYRAMAAKEQNPADKADLLTYATRADEELARFRAAFRDFGDVELELLPGPLSVVERALRMSANKWQTLIRPDMPAIQKQLHREAADEIGEVLTSLRKARGLPW